MNSINITGRATKDIELRQSTSGISVCSFSIAVKRPRSSETDFFRCVAWRKTAEALSQYVSKGDMVGVTGYIYTRKYTDKNGNEREVIEISADEVTFLGKKSQNTENPQSLDEEFENLEDFDESDMPF